MRTYKNRFDLVNLSPAEHRKTTFVVDHWRAWFRFSDDSEESKRPNDRTQDVLLHQAPYFKFSLVFLSTYYPSHKLTRIPSDD